MAAYFLDTSALVKYYLDEGGSDWVESVNDESPASEIAIAQITGAEMIAAITRRSRQGRIQTAEATMLISAFRNHFQVKFNQVVVSADIVELAMRLAEAHGLRGYDSVQLACAFAFNEELAATGEGTIIFVSADAALNLAAQQEGLVVEDPNSH